MAEFDNFYLVQGDALQMDLDQLILDTLGAPHRCKVVANLPYYITTPLVMHFLEQGFSIDRIVIMVQKEVAQRFTAQPGKKITARSPYRSTITAVCAALLQCRATCLPRSPM